MKHLCMVMLVAACVAFPASAALISTGDVLEITVKEHEEFSGVFTVASDGTIDYPLLADEVVVNVSTSELMNHLTFILAKHIDNPLVIISVVEKPMMTVTVLGQITDPGPVSTYQGATMQEILTRAGGPTAQADLTKIKILRSGGTEQSAVFCDLKSFLSNGSLAQMPPVQPDDVIILLSTERTRKVKVIGAVNKPGFFSPDAKVNVFELIYMAGGPTSKADLSRVRRFFKHEEKTMEEVLDIQSYMDRGDLDNIPMVEAGDVIIIYAKWFDWRTVLDVINNVLLFVVTIQALGGVFK